MNPQTEQLIQRLEKLEGEFFGRAVYSDLSAVLTDAIAELKRLSAEPHADTKPEQANHVRQSTETHAAEIAALKTEIRNTELLWLGEVAACQVLQKELTALRQSPPSPWVRLDEKNSIPDYLDARGECLCWSTKHGPYIYFKNGLLGDTTHVSRLPAPPKVKTPAPEFLQLAAQAWCAPTTEHKIMDVELAMEFARILEARVTKASS